MNQHEDTYFLNYEAALKTAKEQNMINEYEMQVCYYDGEKIDSSLKNLINIPFDSISTEFLIINERTPTKISTEGFILSKEIEQEIVNSFNSLLISIKQNKEKLGRQLIYEIKKKKINFDDTLRIFLYGNKTTKVMQNISFNIAQTFANAGFDVRYECDNELEDFSLYRLIKSISTHSPHIFISINENQSPYLHEDTFNFVWYQDPMPTLVNKQIAPLRKKDTIFSLLPIIDNLLDENNISYERQSFCINTNIFNTKKNIVREDKIIFIGSSYYERLEKSGLNQEHLDHLKKLFYSGFDFNDKAITQLSKEYNYDKSYFEFHIIGALVRFFSVLELCKLTPYIKVEIYGYGWEDIKEVQPYFKGSLNYDELPDSYRSTKYVLAPHSHYIIQQRVLEAAACGAIPIVYDCRSVDNPPFFLDSILLYKNINQLKDLITKEVVDLDIIVKENSYEHFTNNILSTVNKTIKRY